MDTHFRNITIALYQQHRAEGFAYLIHSYSSLEGVGERISFIRKAMIRLGGMEATGEGLIYFPCWSAHEAACKRVFLESCKLASDSKLEIRPLNIIDKKTGLNITVANRGRGSYQVLAEGEAKKKERRVAAITRALCKLGQLEEVDPKSGKVATPCRHTHDAMVGLLLVRAPNVRVAMAEQEIAASQGVLSAPGQQE
jgi:hypothetical protein